jgi:hypothetical protein
MTTNAGNPGPPGASATREPVTPMTQLLDEQQAAALLHVSIKSLQAWRSRGGGPRFVKVNRLVRYRTEDLQTFVLAALRTSTSDPGPALPGRPGSRVESVRETPGQARTPVPSTAVAPRLKPR